MIRVFLSHSSKDKGFVRRLDRDLKSRGFRTWLDEDQIPFGGSIEQAITDGLANSDVLIVVLSRHSVNSEWVFRELHTKFVVQLNKNKVLVIPLLIDECTIPSILTDRRYADFRRAEKYDDSLALLLQALRLLKEELKGEEKDSTSAAANSIFQHTHEILEDLEEEYISSPVHRRIPIVGTLKKIQRSGKKIRLRTFRPSVKIRSIYDHILSVAHSADCLLPHIEHDLRPSQMADLAKCFAYHELSEVILGDFPTFTSLSSNSINYSKLHAVQKLKDVLPDVRKKIAMEYIWMFLSQHHKNSFEAFKQIYLDDESILYKMFKLFDKIDPIIATWRYLHFYRGKLGENPREFNKKMRDFYDNPDIKIFIKRSNVDNRMIDLVEKLQNRKYAWDYYEDPERVFGKEPFFALPNKIIRRVIENVFLFHDGL